MFKSVVVKCVAKSLVFGGVLVGVVSIPGLAVAQSQSYVPAPGGDAVVTKSIALDPAPAFAGSAPVSDPGSTKTAVVEGLIVTNAIPAAPIASVKGVQLSSAETPAFTGSNQTIPLVASSAALLAVGSALIVVNRRGRKSVAK